MAKHFGFFDYSHEAGQALLIIVLVMVIALTVGLSLASRSITNLRNSTDEASSQSAFSAAEAGVEQAVKLGDTTGLSVLSGVNLNDKNKSQISNVDISTINGDEFLLNNGNPVFQDDGQDVWLSSHTDDPAQLFQSTWGNGALETLYVYWGTQSNSCEEPAIEALVITGTRTAPQMQKYVFDSCANRRTVNSFCAIGGANPCPPSVSSSNGNLTVNGINGSISFNYRMQLSITNGLLVRIIPLYKAGSIGIKGTGLPVQGKIITSTGTAGSSGVQTVRKISFFQGFESLPSEFFFSLFTPR